MELKVKTKKELEKCGWKTNQRAVRWRFYKQGFGGKIDDNWKTRRDNLFNRCRLSEEQLSYLGKKHKVKEIYLDRDGKTVLIDLITEPNNRWDNGITLTHECVKGFNYKKWLKDNVLIDTGKKIKGYKVKASESKNKITIGCYSFNKKEMVNSLKFIANLMGYKVTKK